MNYKLHILTNGWEAYYDRQLRLWVGIQRDSERFAIVQDNGEEAVYGASLDDVKASTERLTDAPQRDSSALQRQMVSMQDEIDRLRRIEVEYATVKKMFTFTAKDLEG